MEQPEEKKQLRQKEEFDNALRKVAWQNLEGFLQGLTSPCFESELMREAFPGFRILNATPLELYQKHFLLYKVLFDLQEILRRKNRYLHIHFMRTFLVDFPAPGRCRFYEPHLATFCGEPSPDVVEYCLFHRSLTGGSRLDFLSERYFYQDCRNYFALDEASAAAFINGSWEMLANHGNIRRAFEILGLPEKAGLKAIKATFRELARRHHPDSGAQDEEAFKLVNNAYHLLMRYFARAVPFPRD